MHKKYTFESGLRLITVPNRATKAVTVFMLVGVGSRHETKDINGVSHFIEHLMFKGTKRRPTALDITKDLDRYGAEYNAATAKDWTGYYVKIESPKIELAIDILADILRHSKFLAKDIDRERGVIIEEINMYHDNPMMYIEDILEQAVFQGSSLGWEIGGEKQVIKNISPQKIKEYQQQFYCDPNIVIGIAGNFNQQQAINLIKQHFNAGHLTTEEKKQAAKYSFDHYGLKQSQPRINLYYKKTEQVQIALGFPGFSYADLKMYALYLLSIILGGNMSSRLFISIREKKGLAYFVRCFTNIYQDTGSFIIQAGLDKSRLSEALAIIFQELRKIKRAGVSAKELKQAKDFFQGKLLLTLENSSDLADWYVKQELLENQVHTPEQKIKLFKQVSARQIKQVAHEVLQKKLINLAMIGPYKDQKYFNALLNL